MRVTSDDIRGVLGILPTPSTPDADHWAAEATVDLSSTADMTEMVVSGGIRLLLTNGTFGEGATLTGDEHEAFTATVVDVMGSRGLVFAGVTTLNTRETISRARRLVARGAHGLFLGRPMWMALDHAAIVRYYADIAEALPGVPLILYDNHLAFKGKISSATYAELAKNRAVIASKHIGGPSILEDQRAVGSAMRLLPLDAAWPSFAEAFPDLGVACWTGNVADGPEPLIALEKAVLSRDLERARHIAARMSWAQSAMFPGGSLEVFSDYNIPIAHARLEGSGLVRSGPPRPPYIFCPEAYLEGGRETGRRWKALRTEFPGT